MRKIKEGNVIYLVAKDKDTMDLRCSECGVVKNELDITVEIDKIKNRKVYKCECGCKTFTPSYEPSRGLDPEGFQAIDDDEIPF